MSRKIIEIDRDLCNGCGQCVDACAEGAIQLVEGKAAVVRDEYCDGLGACIGECPTGALRIVERDAAAFDPAAAEDHVRRLRGEAGVQRMHAGHDGEVGAEPARPHGGQARPGGVAPGQPQAHPARAAHVAHSVHAAHGSGGGCPGSRMRVAPAAAAPPAAVAGTGLPARVNPSDLGQWPVQLHLVPVHAPFFAGRELVVLATCGPVASADVHWRFLRGRSVVVACPKLDVTEPYVDKLAAIFRDNDIPRVLVVRMEVPCCGGLTRMVAQARQLSGRDDLAVEEVVLGLQGEVQRQQEV